LEKYYAEHPTRPAPTCRTCGVPITYVPPGRPKALCDACVRPADLRKRKARAA
jgi:hypothetical protein